MGKISRADRLVIKALRIEKNWSACRLQKEFPKTSWPRTSLDRLIEKIELPIDKVIGRGWSP